MYGYMLLFFAFFGASFAFLNTTLRSTILGLFSGFGSTVVGGVTGIGDFLTLWILWAMSPANYFGMLWLFTIILIPLIMMIQGARGRKIR